MGINSDTNISNQTEKNSSSIVKEFEFDISIVIVNYNVRDFLNKCLLSIRNSKTNRKIETIVVDNNSTDGTVNFLKNQFPEVKFIESPENLGFSKANNLGFKEAKGEYILILNPDTLLSTETLDHMYGYMKSNKQVWISGCKILNPDGSFQLPCRRGFPTPWVAFSKLFGLQSLFPKSKIFAKYNQTFRSIEETYYIDAVMGAFMFARADKIKEIGGFDEDYFMYGEDLDLCYRTAKLGGKVAYVHSTSIIHFKGESTKRSSINDIKHFYEAMQIFVRKHYSNSSLFLAILKLGIFIRTFFAYLTRYKNEFPLIMLDLIIVNIVLMISTSVKFGELLGFPDYAYPTVFIVISCIYFLSLFSVGEYFEGEHSIRKLLFGILISFFFLSALTYFFRDYAFSRGVLLMTIGLTFIFGSFLRLLLSSVRNLLRSKHKTKVAIVSRISGISKITEDITAKKLDSQLDFQGFYYLDSTDEISESTTSNIALKGNLDYLVRNLKELAIDEILIFDDNKNSEVYNSLFIKTLDRKVRIHFLDKLDEYLVSQTINEVTTSQSILINHKLILPRYKFAKRLTDIFASITLLTIGLPVILLKKRNIKKNLKIILNVLKGSHSLIGIYPSENIRNYNSKPGLLNLVKFSKDEKLSNDTVRELNDYYEQNYSISLDFDIFIKSIFK